MSDADQQPVDSAISTPEKSSTDSAAKPEQFRYEPPDSKTNVRVLVFVFALMAGGMVFGAMSLLPKLGYWLMWSIYVLFIGGVLLVRIKRLFVDVQSRVAEWLAAIVFAGMVMAIGKSWLPRFFPVSPDDENFYMVLIAIGAVIWSFGGAAWGWNMAKRLKQHDSRKRLGYIASAWVIVPAVSGFSISVVVAGWGAVDGPWEHIVYGTLGCLVAIALVIPAIRLDRAAPLLTSQRAMGGAWKPAVVDNFESCRFGPAPLRLAVVILNLTGFNLMFLPFLIRRLQKSRVPVDVKEVQLEQFPASVVEFLQDYHESLRELGFQRRWYLRSTGASKNVVTFSANYFHRELGQTASISATYVLTHQGGQLHRCAVDIASGYEDGFSILTSNACDLGFPAQNPSRDTLRFPEVGDLSLLHRVHCARVKKSERPAVGFIQSEILDVTQVQKEMERIIDFEFKGLNSLSGAYYNTWSVVWPASLVREYLMRRRARAEMKALGFGDQLH